MAYLEDDLYNETTDGVLLLKNDSIGKSIIKLNNAIKTIKLSFVNTTSSMPYPVKTHLIHQEL